MRFDRELEQDIHRQLTVQKRAPLNSALLVLGQKSAQHLEQPPGSVCLRDYPEFSKLRELPSETLMRVDTIREASLADFDCA